MTVSTAQRAPEGTCAVSWFRQGIQEESEDNEAPKELNACTVGPKRAQGMAGDAVRSLIRHQAYYIWFFLTWMQSTAYLYTCACVSVLVYVHIHIYILYVYIYIHKLYIIIRCRNQSISKSLNNHIYVNVYKHRYTSICISICISVCIHKHCN